MSTESIKVKDYGQFSNKLNDGFILDRKVAQKMEFPMTEISKPLSESLITKDYFNDVDRLHYHLKCVQKLQERLFSNDVDITTYKSKHSVEFPSVPKEVRSNLEVCKSVLYQCIKELTIDHENGEHSTYNERRLFNAESLTHLHEDVIKEHFKIIEG